jgi:hypothetical protein
MKRKLEVCARGFLRATGRKREAKLLEARAKCAARNRAP